MLTPSASRAAGRHHAAWDGRDDTGHLQQPGIYFIRLTTPQDWRGGRFGSGSSAQARHQREPSRRAVRLGE